jgi:hypothetical protein
VIISDITEFAAGEHPRAYDLKPSLPCHFSQREKSIFAFLFPTLQNLRQENRVFKRENLSAFQLKDFSFNTRFLANYVVG